MERVPFDNTAPTYYLNRDPSEELYYINTEVKIFEGYHYVTPHQKQVIIDNINSNILSELLEPLLDNCVNLAGSTVSRKQALKNAFRYTEVPVDGDFSWAAGFKLVAKHKDDQEYHTYFPYNRTPTVDFQIPYGSWQSVPTAPKHHQPDCQVDFIGYSHNTNWLPYNNWFNSVHLHLCRKLPKPILKHILSYWIWRRVPKKGTRPLCNKKPPLRTYIGSSRTMSKRTRSENNYLQLKVSEHKTWAELYGETNPWFDSNSKSRRDNALIPSAVNPLESLNPVHQN